MSIFPRFPAILVSESNVLKTVTPFTYHGSLQVPYSKSYLQRAIAIGLLSRQEVIIEGFTPSNDAVIARTVARVLGADSTLSGTHLHLFPAQFSNNAVTISCGEAGLSTRMFSPIAASLCNDVTVQGEGSILVRPMNMVIDALEKLGATVSSNNGKLPLHIQGGITSGTLEIDGSESSQLLTGLLIALSFTPGKSTIHVKSLKSIPYVQMTLDILSDFGITVHHENFETFHIPKVPESLKDKSYTVEGDWSAASFHVVGAALSGQITLRGLHPISAQADRAILDAVKMAGANVAWEKDILHISEGTKKAFEFDATHCPDLFPPLAALAAGCEGTSVISGVARLASKESNRGLTIQSELAKLGVHVRLVGDKMFITGATVHGGEIDSNNDHRIAMMGAILATLAKDSIQIKRSEAVHKSYPTFFEDIVTISREKDEENRLE